MAPLNGSVVDLRSGAEEHLTRAEDDDLRRLTWLSQMGTLSECKRRCLTDLLVRDRRDHVRAPREFQEP